jgi:hypothetical protein
MFRPKNLLRPCTGAEPVKTYRNSENLIKVKVSKNLSNLTSPICVHGVKIPKMLARDTANALASALTLSPA